MNNHEDRRKILIPFFSFVSRIIDSENKKTCLQAKRRAKFLGPVPERKNNSIPGINVPYSRDNFIPGITSVPDRRNSAMQGINLG